MMMPSSIRTILVKAVRGYIDDRAMSMGAAIAYYTVFSLAPILILVIAVAGLVFGEDAARGAIVAQLGGLMGQEGAQALQAMIRSAGETTTSTIAGIIGIVMLVIAATTVFAELQSALNIIWKAPPPKVSTVTLLVRVRLASLALIVGMGFLLLVSLIVNAALTALGGWLAGILPGLDILLHIANAVLSLTVITALFAMVYKLLPDTPIPWRDVWVAAIITALLFTIGKYLISLYIGSSKIASTYGAAGALVIILLWVYYSAQIFLFGAEIAWAYSETHGSRSAGKPVGETSEKPAGNGARFGFGRGRSALTRS